MYCEVMGEDSLANERRMTDAMAMQEEAAELRRSRAVLKTFEKFAKDAATRIKTVVASLRERREEIRKRKKREKRKNRRKN